MWTSLYNFYCIYINIHRHIVVELSLCRVSAVKIAPKDQHTYRELM